MALDDDFDSPPITSRRCARVSWCRWISLWKLAVVRDPLSVCCRHVAANEAESVIIFIEERYGGDGVIRFLNALGKSTSLEEALEAGLSIEVWRVQSKEWSKVDRRGMKDGEGMRESLIPLSFSI